MRLLRATRWRPTGAFGHGESAIELGRDPPVSESRSSSSGVRVLPTRRSRQILRLVAEALLPLIESRELIPRAVFDSGGRRLALTS